MLHAGSIKYTLYILWTVANRSVHINVQLAIISAGDNPTQQIPAPVLQHEANQPNGLASGIDCRVSIELLGWLYDCLVWVGGLDE